MKKILLLAIFVLGFNTLIGQVLNPSVISKVSPKVPVIKGLNSEVPKSVKYTLWKTLLNNSLRSSFLKFNNYDANGVNHGDGLQYHKYKDVHLRIGNPPMGIDTIFDYLPLRFDPFTVYFKNINTNKIVVDAKNKKLNFYVSFEKDDIEIATNCVDNIICGGIGNPNFHIDDLSFSIEIEPYTENGKIRYRNAIAKISANAGHDGFNFLITPLDPLARALNGPLFELASNKITEYFNKEETINNLSEQLYQGIIPIRSVLGFSTTTPYFTAFYIDETGNIMYSIR